MKKTNMLIILILSLGLMLTACGSEEKDNNDSIYVPPPLTSSSNDDNDDYVPLFDEKCFDGIDNDGDALIDEDCNSNFVAVGDDGIIVYSDDGTAWKADESRSVAGKGLMDIASDMASGSWVAVGTDNNVAGFVIKYDVVTGLQTTDLSSDDIIKLNGIASDGNGTWYAVGKAEYKNDLDEWIIEGIISTSNDGLEWTPIRNDVNERYKDVVYGNGKWIVVGWKIGDPPQGIVRSSDDWEVAESSDDWEVAESNANGWRFFNVAYDMNDNWFVTGVDTSDKTVIIEFDSEWNIVSDVSKSDIFINGIASDVSGNVVAVGEDNVGNGIVVASSDNWDIPSDAASPGKALLSVVKGNSSWFAVGMNGTIVTMTFPTSTPSVVPSVTDKNLNAIAFKP